MSLIVGETIIRIRRSMVHDPMSGQDTLGSWDDAARTEVHDCLFAPATSDQFPQVELEQLSQLGTLYMRLHADVRPLDRVEVDGALWDVRGRPSNWPGTLVSGSTVNLKWVRDL